MKYFLMLVGTFFKYCVLTLNIKLNTMQKYQFRIIFYLSILCFACQNNSTIAEIQITVEDQTFTISNNLNEGAIIGQIESASSVSVNYFLLTNAFSYAFTIDSISGDLILTNVSIFKEINDNENGIELELLTTRTGNYIEYGVISSIFINVNNDPKEKLWDSSEEQANLSDAVVNSLLPTTNFENPGYYKASAWTNNLQTSIIRTYLKFDISTIPKEAKVCYAKLYLYSPSDSKSEHSHSTLSGSNDFFVRRISEEWDSQLITWENQPAYYTEDEVLCSSSLTFDQNYEIDITAIVQSIIENELDNYGFLIMLSQELFYRQICFASNNYQNQSLRPHLQIKYK
jgi:hypothetical protein